MGTKHSSPRLWLKWSLIAVSLFKWGCSPAWKLPLYFNPGIIADAFQHTPLTLHKIAHFSTSGIETFPAISREQRQPGVSQSPEPAARYTCKVWELFCLQHCCPQPRIWLTGNRTAPSQSRRYASEWIELSKRSKVWRWEESTGKACGWETGEKEFKKKICKKEWRNYEGIGTQANVMRISPLIVLGSRHKEMMNRAGPINVSSVQNSAEEKKCMFHQDTLKDTNGDTTKIWWTLVVERWLFDIKQRKTPAHNLDSLSDVLVNRI